MMAQTRFAHTEDGRLSERLAETTIVFTCHNRRDLVLRAIPLALVQTIPVHIIVADDASTDGTQQAVLQQFPDITYLRSETSRGPCYQRNAGVEAASTPFVFPLDDDSMLVDPATLEQALADFTADDIAIVCMPFINILQDDVVRHQIKPGIPNDLLDSAACAHVVRRDAFLAVGGYNEDLFYTMEEGDLALRLLNDGGWRTVLGTSPPLHHMQLLKKVSDIQDYTGGRNKVLFYYRYAPAMIVPGRIAGAAIKDMMLAIRRRRPMPCLRGIRDGLGMVLTGRAKRTPVRREVFRYFVQQRAYSR